jgi:hypothetical protein
MQLSLKMQVWHVVFMISVKALLNGTLAREADRERESAAYSGRVRARLAPSK